MKIEANINAELFVVRLLSAIFDPRVAYLDPTDVKFTMK